MTVVLAKLRALLPAWVCTGLLCASDLPAQEWKELFNPYRVITLHLELDSNDWDRVRHDQPIQNESWVPELAEALMWADGEAPIRVQIRRKGESDIPLPESNPQKVSLKIDINALVPGQKWRGLNKLSLENGSEDPLNEGFAWMVHRLAWESGINGYESAYSGWVKLYINGDLKGVFVNAEQKDAQFLRNRGFDNELSTWLYKVDGNSTLEVGTGDSPTSAHLCYLPFAERGGTCAQPNLEVDLPQWIDIRGFFAFAAVEAFLENKDGLFTHSGKNSYAVDFDPPYPTTRLYFPWDQDSTIFQGTASIYGNEPYQQTFLKHPWFGRIYEQSMHDLIEGPFSVTNLLAVINRLETGIGAAFDDDSYVYDGDSSEAFQSLRNWANTRVPNVRSQLTQPVVPRPVLNQMGGEVVAGFHLIMSASTGTVYYTMDGTDPRAPGGSVSPSAVPYISAIVIERNTPIVARTKSGTNWSALPVKATFNIARYANALRITEMMYHPAQQTVAGDEDNYEFIELKNTGTTPLNLSGFFFEGITYSFPAGTILPPNGFQVLARNHTVFANRYPGRVPNGIFTGKLDDGGEKIRLRSSDNNVVISVEYDDDPPWPLSPDGLGYSLVLHNFSGNPDSPTTWRASANLHGSPGEDDPMPAYSLGIVINEVLAHADSPLEDAIELRNTSASDVNIGGWFLSDDFAPTNAPGAYSLKKFRIPDNTVIVAGGYRVFYQRDFDQANPLTPFALSEFGETVYLSAAGANGTLMGFIEGATFRATEQGVAIGRHQTSRDVDFIPLNQPTFGASAPSTVAEFRAGAGAPNAMPRVGPLILNEIMYNPATNGTEFLEFLSVANAPLDISGWNVIGTGFFFPANTVIEPRGFLVLLKTNTTSVAAFRSNYAVPVNVPILSGDFVLENEGEALRIEKPNTLPTEPFILIERVRYNDKSPWPTEADGEGPSLERFAAFSYGNDPVNWRTVSDGGSPGRENLFEAGVAIEKRSSWNYQPNGSNLGTPWRDLNYNDSGWPNGDGVLGYGASSVSTLVPFGPISTNKFLTVYFRKEFVINDPVSTVANLKLHAMYDDGFVLYLNGTEVLRSGSMPDGWIAFDTPASVSYNSVGYEVFDLSPFIDLLQAGNNLLCAEVHQESGASDDLLWDASLTFDVSTLPRVATPVIMPAGGRFTNQLEVALATVPTNALIYYTLNGTEPDQSSFFYTGPFTITTTTKVTSRAYLAGYNESAIAQAEFILPGPGVLEVLPTGESVSSGATGGPFFPAFITYTLTNSGGHSLNWSASADSNRLSLTGANGWLAPNSTTNVVVTVQGNALPAGSYVSTMTFSNVTGGTHVSRTILLSVKPTRVAVGYGPGPGALEITVSGQSNFTYVIEVSSNLVHWVAIVTNATGTNGFWKHVEEINASIPYRFYRGKPQR
jgi:spore coat protein CotH